MGPSSLSGAENIVQAAGRRTADVRLRDDAHQSLTAQFDDHDYDEIDETDAIGKSVNRFFLLLNIKIFETTCAELEGRK